MRFDQVGYNIFHQHCISSNRGFLTNYSGFAFCNNLCFLQMMQLAFSKLKKMYTLYELPENSKDCLSSCFHENVDQPFFHLRWRPSEFSPEIKHMSVTWGNTKMLMERIQKERVLLLLFGTGVVDSWHYFSSADHFHFLKGGKMASKVEQHFQ